MIASDVNTDDFSYCVNLGTPYTKAEFKVLKDWVEGSAHRILVSGAYHNCDEYFSQPDCSQIRRDGYMFMFWFENKDAAEEFAVAMAGQAFGCKHVIGVVLPVLENFPPGSPNARFRVMESLYAGTPWFEEGWRKKETT